MIRDDLFENMDEFVLSVPDSKEKKFGDLDSKSKAAFTREYNKTAHTSQALVAEQGLKAGRKKDTGGTSEVEEGGELDVVDDDKAAGQYDDEQDDEEDVEALKEMFMKKKASAASKAKGAKSVKGKRKSG